MDPSRRANLKQTVGALAEDLAGAWTYFYVLSGLHEGARAFPNAIERFGFFHDRTYRAVFDGLFAKVGTFLDATKGTHSLPNLLTLIRRYAPPDIKGQLPAIEARLAEKGTAVAKVRVWRHQAVAHRVRDRDPEFHKSHRITLAEIEEALSELEDLLNRLSVPLLGVYNDTRSAFDGLLCEGVMLFESAASGLRLAHGGNDHKPANT